MWFTEDAWSPIILCIVAGAILFIAYVQTQRSKFLYPVPVLVVIIIALFFVEQAVTTDREKVNGRLKELMVTLAEETQAAKSGKIPQNIRCFDYFTEDNVIDRGLVRMAITRYAISDIRNPSVESELGDDKTTATTDFRANGTYSTNTAGGHFATRWKLDWRKIGGDWKISKTTMLNVGNGEEMSVE
jgi:hypothetical protein